MSRVDENGVRHPTAEDPLDLSTEIHLTHCLECNPYARRKVKVTDRELDVLVGYVKGTQDTSMLSEDEVRGMVMAIFGVERA